MTDSGSAPPPPATNAIAVIVDCNCFLQLRDLKDLPWGDVFPGVDRVEIMVTPFVVAELDRKKVDTKDRIRNRARAANKLLDQASEVDPMRVVLKDGPLTVALNLPEIAPTNWTQHARLDVSRPDDNLVAQAIDLGTDLPKALLSHDSGPRVAARRLGFTAKSVPDLWLLPDLADDERKQIQRLQRENEQLRASRPQILAGWGNAYQPLAELTIEQLIVPSLTGEMVSAAVALCRAQWPHATATLKMGNGFFIGDDDVSGQFDEDDYLRYLKKWTLWADGLTKFFEELPNRISFATRFSSADLWFENVGAATAQRLTVDFSVSDGWLVVADQEAVNEIAPFPMRLPAAPLTPFHQDHRDRAAKADEAGRLAGLVYHRPDPPRDPTQFYWSDRPRYESTRGIYVSEEFRAKRRHEDQIFLWKSDPAPSDGKLVVDIHGFNLGEPLSMELPLRFAEREVNWEEPAVLAALDHPLAAIIQEATAPNA